MRHTRKWEKLHRNGNDIAYQSWTLQTGCIRTSVSLIILAASVSCYSARGEIGRWDNSELIPGTEGIELGPGVRLDRRDLEYAALHGRDLTGANFSLSNLAHADFSTTNLNDANLFSATLNETNFSDTSIKGANLVDTTSRGFTKEQLYSTASYKQQDLQGVVLRNDLAGWDFSGQNLTNADLSLSALADTSFVDSDLTNVNLVRSTLTGANLSGAVVNRARLVGTTSIGFTKQQLYSTASYTAKNLQGVMLMENDLTGWDFRGQNLMGANFSYSTLTDVDLTDAIVKGVLLNWSSGFTKEQLYSTASYQAKDLQGIWLRRNDLTDWDFSGQDLSHADLSGATAKNAILTDAVVHGTRFNGMTSKGFAKEQIYSTASYRAGNLQGIGLASNNMTGWDLSEQNLADANLTRSVLKDTNFSGAVITGANFSDTTANGFTKEQFYSTDSYKAKNLEGIGLESDDLTEWNLSGQNLVDSNFFLANLTNADLSLANLTNAILEESTLAGANLSDANLAGANLQVASITQANLAGANLKNAFIQLPRHAMGLDSANFDSETVYNQWTIFPQGFDPVEQGLTKVTSPTGDFDGNDVLDASDIDMLIARIGGASPLGFWVDDIFDVNDDSTIDQADLRGWVKDHKKTWFGDSNLDGEFNSADLVSVFKAGQYEDGILSKSTWSSGDWNGDGDFNTSDLVTAFKDGGYEIGFRQTVSAVPEPSTYVLALVGFVAIANTFRWRKVSPRRSQ